VLFVVIIISEDKCFAMSYDQIVTAINTVELF